MMSWGERKLNRLKRELVAPHKEHDDPNSTCVRSFFPLPFFSPFSNLQLQQVDFRAFFVRRKLCVFTQLRFSQFLAQFLDLQSRQVINNLPCDSTVGRRTLPSQVAKMPTCKDRKSEK